MNKDELIIDRIIINGFYNNKDKDIYADYINKKRFIVDK